MSNTTAPSAYTLQRIISAAMQKLDDLRTEHGLVLDEDTVLPSLTEEGIDLDSVLTRLVEAAIDNQRLAAMTKARINILRASIADLEIRDARFERGDQTCRAILIDALGAVGKKNYRCASATATISVGRDKVLITDLDAVPKQYVKVVEVKTADKVALLPALKLGPVNGAELSNGGATLSLRSK